MYADRSIKPTNLKWIYLEKGKKLKTKNIIKTFDTVNYWV
jgi:hypothetical protein